MRRGRAIGIACFVLVLLLCGVGSLRQLYAQATAGYTKVNSTAVSATTFTTGTLTDGVAYNFEVTGVNSAGIESLPSSIVTLVIPNSGTHTVTLVWTAGTGDATFNVYDQQVASANPPAALSGTVN